MKMTKLTLARLLVSGAIVGIALGNLLGLDFSGFLPTDLVTSVAGAAGTAVIFKIVHLI